MGCGMLYVNECPHNDRATRMCELERERGQKPLFSTAARFLFVFPEGYKFAATLIVCVGPSGYIQSHLSVIATWLWRRLPNGNTQRVTSTSSGGQSG